MPSSNPTAACAHCPCGSVIATAGAGNSAQAELVVVYVTLATALVWGPVVSYVVRGEKAMALMKAAQEKASQHQPAVTIYALRGLAALLFMTPSGFPWYNGRRRRRTSRTAP